MVVCVQDVVRENGFLFQFEDCHNDDISYCLLVFLCSKEDIEVDEPISHYPKK